MNRASAGVYACGVPYTGKPPFRSIVYRTDRLQDGDEVWDGEIRRGIEDRQHQDT